MKKISTIYNIHFLITDAYGEWIYKAHYTKKSRRDANRFLKNLAEKSKASSLVKSDKLGLNYFKATEPETEFISQGYITVETKQVKVKRHDKRTSKGNAAYYTGLC